MSSNGRRRWRKWFRSFRKVRHCASRDKDQGFKRPWYMRRHPFDFGSGPGPIPAPAFAARGLVVMSMGSRKRAA